MGARGGIEASKQACVTHHVSVRVSCKTPQDKEERKCQASERTVNETSVRRALKEPRLEAGQPSRKRNGRDAMTHYIKQAFNQASKHFKHIRKHTDRQTDRKTEVTEQTDR
eukprot:7933834-Alexandrium_andersonii.AAC.1